ncbi:MAG: GDSL-type esterase/lipase family protein [Chitinophagaceae bacterium]
MKLKKILLLVGVVLCVSVLYAQKENQPFYKEVMALKKLDSITPPPANPILFIGSSSFTKWTNVQEMFPGYTILNRAFGGSSLPQMNMYAEDIIFPYNPKQIVIYCGENDVAASDTIDSKIVSDRFISLFRLIRNRLPKAQIVYVSMKPSPSREKFWKTFVQGNQIIKNYIWTQPNATYVDVTAKMMGPDGKPMKEIFTSDMLHMNQDGYKIWQSVLLPYLMKN